MTGILEGVKVIDMGHFVAIPSAAAVLADWGADVIKVEPLSGEPQRGIRALGALTFNGGQLSWRAELHNRNKKGLAVDLKKASGRDILYQLVKRSDVFMSNYEVSSLKRLELDYASLSRVNSKIIYAILTAFGRVGPDKDERGFDFIASWARSGVQYLLGEEGRPPPMQRPGLMDRVAGTHVVAGVVAALLYREKTGKGQELEFSLYHSAVWSLAADVQATLLGIKVPKHEHSKAMNPLVNTYCTKDGQWLQLAMLQSDLQWSGFCRAIDRPKLENDPKFNNIEVREQNNEELVSILDDVFISENMVEWEKRLREHGCIYGRVRTLEDVATDTQALVNGLFTDIEHPLAGKIKLVATPVKFCQNPASIKTAAPEVGQHTEEILLDLGYSWDDLAQLKEEGVIL